jgi:hypothetical protein
VCTYVRRAGAIVPAVVDDDPPDPARFRLLDREVHRFRPDAAMPPFPNTN